MTQRPARLKGRIRRHEKKHLDIEMGESVSPPVIKHGNGKSTICSFAHVTHVLTVAPATYQPIGEMEEGIGDVIPSKKIGRSMPRILPSLAQDQWVSSLSQQVGFGQHPSRD